jgi:hypothetical protein
VHDLGGRGRAKASNYNFELTQVRSECAGPQRFNVHMSFKPAPDAKQYTVASGNACQLKGVACGLSGAGCTVTCSGQARASSIWPVPAGTGSSLVKVLVPYRYNPITAKIQAPRYPALESDQFQVKLGTAR